MKTLIMVTPFWKRPILTWRYLNHMQRWKEHSRGLCKFTVVMVGSEKARSRSLVEGTGFWYIEHPNDPLGAKFNAGVKKALSIGADYILIMGSDQFADVSMLDHFTELMEQNVPYAGVLDTYVLDDATNRALYWKGYTDYRKGRPIGPGRLIRSDIAAEWDGEIYDRGLNRNLDGSADARLPEPVVFSGKPYRFVSVKTGESITPAERYRGPAVKVSLFEDFFE